jgi:hypothetical protein
VPSTIDTTFGPGTARALEARGEDDLLVIGRTDALPAMGLDEAVRRAALYAMPASWPQRFGAT